MLMGGVYLLSSFVIRLVHFEAFFPARFLHLKPHIRALRDVAIEVELQRYSKLKAAVLAASNQKELEEVKVPEGFDSWRFDGNGEEVMICMYICIRYTVLYSMYIFICVFLYIT